MERASAIGQVTGILLDTMRKLASKEIDPGTAQAIALNGRAVIDAAKAETDFIRTVKAIPREGVWGSRLQYLEPQVDDPEERTPANRLEARVSGEAEKSPWKRTKSEIYGPSAEEWR